MRQDAAIEILAISPQLAALVRARVPLSGIPDAQRSARRTLAASLDRAGVTAGQRLTVWRPPEGGFMEYAPGVLVAHAFEVSDEVELFTLPSGRAAHLRLDGPYEGLPNAWQQLFEGCRSLGAEPAGLNWEIYEDGMPPDGPATDLYALLR